MICLPPVEHKVFLPTVVLVLFVPPGKGVCMNYAVMDRQVMEENMPLRAH